MEGQDAVHFVTDADADVDADGGGERMSAAAVQKEWPAEELPTAGDQTRKARRDGSTNAMMMRRVVMRRSGRARGTSQSRMVRMMVRG